MGDGIRIAHQYEFRQTGTPIRSPDPAPRQFKEEINTSLVGPAKPGRIDRQVTQVMNLAGGGGHEFGTILPRQGRQSGCLFTAVIMNEDGHLGIEPARRFKLKVDYPGMRETIEI